MNEEHLNEEHLIDRAHRAIQRIMAINWENSFDSARIDRLEFHLHENLGVIFRTRLTCLWYVRWYAIEESATTNIIVN